MNEVTVLCARVGSLSYLKIYDLTRELPLVAFSYSCITVTQQESGCIRTFE